MARLNYYSWGKTNEITFEIHEYANNGNLAIQMICWDEGFPEPYSMLTVNLDKKCRPNCAFIDINNNGYDIINWLVVNNLGRVTGSIRTSGWCTYPEFEFNMDELKKYVESGK